MNMHSGGNTYETDSVVPFAPRAAAPSDEADQLDKAGQIILRLLHKAAGVAEENSRHALDTAQKLSHHPPLSSGHRLPFLAARSLCHHYRAP
jgi:hypothetical protein